MTIILVIGLAFILSIFDIRICPFFNLFHIPCIGCGLTRSFKLLFQGKVLESFEYNLLAFPLLIIFSFYLIFKILKKEYKIKEYINIHQRKIIIIYLIVFIFVWLINIFNPNLY